MVFSNLHFDDNDYAQVINRENREETERLAQPNNAYAFLGSIKEMFDDSVERDERLPGFVQVLEIRKTVGEFRPGGHYKEVVAKVLCEDGSARIIRGVEDYYAGTQQSPPDGEITLEELTE